MPARRYRQQEATDTEKNDGAQEREQEAQPQGEGHHGEKAAQAQQEEQIAGSTGRRGQAPASREGRATSEPAPSVPDASAWQAKLAAKDAEMADMKVGYELQLADTKNVKAAKALLADHKGDIAALKQAEPWMFEAAAASTDDTPAGKTGLSNAGAAMDEGAQLKRWRKLAGLEDE